MTTFITGAGFIGAYTAHLLAERGEKSVLFDIHPSESAIAAVTNSPLVSLEKGDITDAKLLTVLCERYHITKIVHTAAMLSTAIRTNPILGVNVNVMGTMHLLEIARKRKIARLVMASSTTVHYPSFGSFLGGLFPEDFPMKAITNRPGSIYSASKIASEYFALLYRDLYQVSIVALRYAAVISAWRGPGTSVVTQLMSKLVEGGKANMPAKMDDPFLIWKGGEEFIDGRDCARANIAALDASDPKQGVYTIGQGALYAFSDFVDAVRALYPSLSVEMRLDPKGGFAGFPFVRTAASDISKAKAEIAWEPLYRLPESIAHFSKFL